MASTMRYTYKRLKRFNILHLISFTCLYNKALTLYLYMYVYNVMFTDWSIIGVLDMIIKYVFVLI